VECGSKCLHGQPYAERWGKSQSYFRGLWLALEKRNYSFYVLPWTRGFLFSVTHLGKGRRDERQEHGRSERNFASAATVEDSV
jgi:hypothetical protein